MPTVWALCCIFPADNSGKQRSEAISGAAGAPCGALRYLFFPCNNRWNRWTNGVGTNRNGYAPARMKHRSAAMTYPTHLIPTTVVGSYPQPDWLVDRGALAHHGVPRVAARDIWRVAEPWLEAAQDDATVLAIGDMERAGIDIVSDGEIRRESYS